MTLIEKIKALLAKAASTDNAAEAMAFADKASELMDKYQVDADALGDADDAVGRDCGYETKQRNPVWQSYVASAAGRYYGCEAIHSGRTGAMETILFGRESARITALEMTAYFISTINRLAREIVAADAAAGVRSHQRATAHRIGLEFAIRLKEMTPKRAEAATAAGGNALVLLNQQLAMLRDTFPNAGKMKATKFSTTSSAKAAAASISVNRQTGHRSNLRLA